jgi:hypothetical protein
MSKSTEKGFRLVGIRSIIFKLLEIVRALSLKLKRYHFGHRRFSMSNLKKQIAYQILQSRLPEAVNTSLGLSDNEFDVGT